MNQFWKTCLLCLLMAALLLPAFAEDDISITEMSPDMEAAFALEDDDAAPDAGETPKPVEEADGSVLITVTATGDLTIGGDSRKRTNIFETELKKRDRDINFTMQNVKRILEQDDLTLVNFEGTLTESKYVPDRKKGNQFLFSAPPAYVSMLTDNSIEAVSLENNHVMDHGEEAYEETKTTLRDAGVVYSNSTEEGVIEIKGVPVCMLSYLCIDRYDQLWTKVPEDIARAKAQYPIVIVNFHWGNEKDYKPTNNQIKMGRLAVDAGADLIIGNHSHRMNPIEQYKGKYICYSLGNFCFAGNKKPSDMTSIMFQTQFRVKDGQVTNEGFRIIPIRISSRTDRNDFVPTPLTKAASIDGVINTLKENGRNLEYAVTDYPLELPVPLDE